MIKLSSTTVLPWYNDTMIPKAGTKPPKTQVVYPRKHVGIEYVFFSFYLKPLRRVFAEK